MVKNVGSPDRILRLILGLGLAALAYFHYIEGTAAIVVYIVAAYLILTAILGMCLFYRVGDFDTCVKETSYSETDDRAGF